ncbi:MAG: hypothetical protein JNM96_05530 [Bacteroidia bacterium]|nr:hypothetical protein [Bacteroidia bacterium]
MKELTQNNNVFSINKLTLLVFLFSNLFNCYSQNFIRNNEWKKYKNEFTFGFGPSNFLGDLGGLNRVGTDFSPVDLEFKQTSMSVSLGYKYKIQKWLNFCFDLSYLKVRGDDKLTTEPFRNNRNLNFKSRIFETDIRLELLYMHNAVGNRYKIKRTLKNRMKTKSYDISGFIGVGGFYFNPYGLDKNGKWHQLKPLRTEGQGLPGGPKPYSNYAICIPMGIGFHYYIDRKWSVGIEFNYRKTFTDYIDDVSTVYYDKAELKRLVGPKAVEMADPSKGVISGATLPDASGGAAQRGDINKDSYMSLQVKVGYILKKSRKRKKVKLRSKF